MIFCWYSNEAGLALWSDQNRAGHLNAIFVSREIQIGLCLAYFFFRNTYVKSKNRCQFNSNLSIYSISIFNLFLFCFKSNPRGVLYFFWIVGNLKFQKSKKLHHGNGKKEPITYFHFFYQETASCSNKTTVVLMEDDAQLVRAGFLTNQ
jgi:hypothetical protein